MSPAVQARRPRELAIAVTCEGVRISVARVRLAAVARLVLRAEQVERAMLSVTFVSNAAIARLNAKQLGHSGATDVISFGFANEAGGPVIGDIYIAPAVARVNARRAGVAVREELVRLVAHGVLHVLGHDHPTGADRMRSPMWRRQEQLVARAMRAALP